jgi:hypothetical protein
MQAQRKWPQNQQKTARFVWSCGARPWPLTPFGCMVRRNVMDLRG